MHDDPPRRLAPPWPSSCSFALQTAGLLRRTFNLIARNSSCQLGRNRCRSLVGAAVTRSASIAMAPATFCWRDHALATPFLTFMSMPRRRSAGSSDSPMVPAASSSPASPYTHTDKVINPYRRSHPSSTHHYVWWEWRSHSISSWRLPRHSLIVTHHSSPSSSPPVSGRLQASTSISSPAAPSTTPPRTAPVPHQFPWPHHSPRSQASTRRDLTGDGTVIPVSFDWRRLHRAQPRRPRRRQRSLLSLLIRASPTLPHSPLDRPTLGWRRPPKVRRSRRGGRRLAGESLA